MKNYAPSFSKIIASPINHAGLAIVTVKGGAGHRFMKGTQFVFINSQYEINHYSKHLAHCRSHIKVTNKQRVV